MTEIKYRAEYAKTGYERCETCQLNIEQDSLTIIIREQIKFLDDTKSDWFHALCFFNRMKVKTIEQISNLDNIRWRDREFIKRKIGEQSGIYSTDSICELKSFKIDYSPSDFTRCFGCHQSIPKDQLRITKEIIINEDETCEDEKISICYYDYYHLGCFQHLRRSLGFFEAGSMLPGFYEKVWFNHRQQVIMSLPDLEFEKSILSSQQTQQNIVKSQNYKLFRIVDEIKKFDRDILVGLLESNDQFVPEERHELIETLADQLAFGALPLCSSCYQFRYVFESGIGYHCMGSITEWTKCNNIITNPLRTKFIIPKKYKDIYKFLRLFDPKVENRIINIDINLPIENGPELPAKFIIPQLSNVNTFLPLDSFHNYASRKDKVKLKIKGGGIVDSNSGLANIASVYQRGREKFTVTLGLTDIEAKKNNYFKMQVLEHDKEDTFWLFTSWGRIGTPIGATELKILPLELCIVKFKSLYEKKTGNKWENRRNFVKKPGMYFAINIEDIVEHDQNLLTSKVTSELSKPVQDLIALIFNVESMKNVMREYELDVEKMPLGALSPKQLTLACQVLNELAEIISNKNSDPIRLIDASNRFYTLVPHSFGINDPPLLGTRQIIESKSEMLHTLMGMAISYQTLSKEIDASKNPIDAHYDQLNTEITVLKTNTPQYQVISTYFQNTQSTYHNHKMTIDQVFVIKRKGEEERYRPFSHFCNKKLLWHGSRTTNFAGILSQGLRIAPPEAPSTGYMFGKGIYFADMVSKSAIYCRPNGGVLEKDSTGLLLLCEVALGIMYKKTNAEFIHKLPGTYNSTWGVGKLAPNRNECFVTHDFVTVPYGKICPNTEPNSQSSSLLHNEYIVYNPGQVIVRYLVRVKFN